MNRATFSHAVVVGR